MNKKSWLFIPGKQHNKNIPNLRVSRAVIFQEIGLEFSIKTSWKRIPALHNVRDHLAFQTATILLYTVNTIGRNEHLQDNKTGEVPKFIWPN